MSCLLFCAAALELRRVDGVKDGVEDRLMDTGVLERELDGLVAADASRLLLALLDAPLPRPRPTFLRFVSLDGVDSRLPREALVDPRGLPLPLFMFGLVSLTSIERKMFQCYCEQDSASGCRAGTLYFGFLFINYTLNTVAVRHFPNQMTT